MPYIKPERRQALGLSFKEIPQDEGELNYTISVLLDAYMWQHGLSYPRMGDCVGACSNAEAEFRRRVMDGYEDQKIRENGDVYREGVRWENVTIRCPVCGSEDLCDHYVGVTRHFTSDPEDPRDNHALRTLP